MSHFSNLSAFGFPMLFTVTFNEFYLIIFHTYRLIVFLIVEMIVFLTFNRKMKNQCASTKKIRDTSNGKYGRRSEFSCKWWMIFSCGELTWRILWRFPLISIQRPLTCDGSIAKWFFFSLPNWASTFECWIEINFCLFSFQRLLGWPSKRSQWGFDPIQANHISWKNSEQQRNLSHFFPIRISSFQEHCQ